MQMYVKFECLSQLSHLYPLPQTEILICRYLSFYPSQSFFNWFVNLVTFVGCPISGFLDPAFAANNKGPDAQPADDPRAMIALARVNWLHSKYKIVCLNLLH